MLVYTRYGVGEQRPQRRKSRRWILLLGMTLLAGLIWFGWHRQVGRKKSAANNSVQTNALQITNALSPAQKRTAQSATLAHSPVLSNRPTIRTDPLPATNNPTAVLEAQIALDRLAISPGSIDGISGSQTRAALRAFQSREGIAQTGELDAATTAKLFATRAPSVTKYHVEAGDLARLCALASTWLGKSEQERLDYESVLELIAERSHAHPALIRKLNGTIEWNAVTPGTEITVPDTEREPPRTKAAFLQIRLGQRTLQAFDATNRLLAHFPCSIAQRVEKRPVGELRVSVVVPDPDYMFNPENFPESAEAQELGRKLRLRPGPNNPVGTAWVGLNLPGYGIHGTPRPEDVGRTESHGCFRLANWNAEYLLQLVTVGTPVRIEP